jgi:DNA-binding response OmpR family regulator
MKVLVVEDEVRIASFIRKGLKEQGFTVEVCDNGDEAHTLASTSTYDALILDIMIPGRDGLSVLRSLRDAKNSVPVIMLTARSSLDERIEGLNLGADDYLTKPFYVEELVARLHAIGRRATGKKLTSRTVRDLRVDLINRDVTKAGESISLTPREFSVLEYLMRSPGRVYTRTQILEHVWGYDFDPSTNLVDVHVRRLRKKIGHDADAPILETVRGVGYKIIKDE